MAIRIHTGMEVNGIVTIVIGIHKAANVMKIGLVKQGIACSLYVLTESRGDRAERVI